MRRRKPMDRDGMLDAIEVALDEGEFEQALEDCERLLSADPDDVDALVLKGHALASGGELVRALKLYERAHGLMPDWDDAEVCQGEILMEIGRFRDAKRLLEAAQRRDPSRAEIQNALAILHELQGDDVNALRHYKLAHKLDSGFHIPVRVSDAEFRAMADELLAAFPEEIRAHLQNVSIQAPDLPTLEMALSQDPPLGLLLLGYFDGTPLSERAVVDAHGQTPAHIYLFKKNLERICRNRRELREQIDVTLKHELGHYLGLDEDDMERLGLD